ncbi:hypothetical protein H3N56_02935 [Cetobacterium sp. 2A]|uniref:hypothetical protein n=1 Tax=Cetobacterium sp. 2A TaxID=2754723 RepID=UPI00163B6B7A|nr:hypothetical protein [Cetobacterium sp. 2A]MBC2855449.1 hypothetical protein [Cetobacterium sp. 2A]
MRLNKTCLSCKHVTGNINIGDEVFLKCGFLSKVEIFVEIDYQCKNHDFIDVIKKNIDKQED